MSVKRGKGIGLVLAVALMLAEVCFGQEGIGGETRDDTVPPASVPESEQPAIEESEYREGIFLNAPSADIRALLQQISQTERINIIATGDVEGSVSVNLYGATVEEALKAILTPKGYAYVQKGNIIYVMKAEAIESFSSQRGPMTVEIYTLDYLSLDDAKELLKVYLSPDGQLKAGKATAAGIPTGETETGGESNAASNVVVIKDYADVHEKVKKALKTLDGRPKQVLVEATLVEVTLDDSNRLGVNFNFLSGVDFSELDATSNLWGINPGEADGELIDDGFSSVGTRGLDFPDSPEGFTIGILKSNLAVFLDALEKVNDTNVLANPKILALNRQRAEIIIGGRLGYYGSETLSEGGFSQQEVEFLDVGTQLRFRPFIGEDEYIRMEIHPERSDGVVDSVTGLPSETTSEVTTNILVKNGDTIVIGGLIEERDTKGVSQVPILGDIPLLGWLFRKEETATKRVEIIVLITPRIVDSAQPDEEAENVLADAKARKHAFRHGFKAYTRTVRAETHAAAAQGALDAGNIALAEFHIGWAETLNPHNPQILRLQEQVSAARALAEPEDDSLEEYIWSEIE